MAKRRFSGNKFNVPQIVEIGLTLLAVQKAPQILNSLLFSGNPLTGMTANLLGAGVGVAAGYFLNKPLVVNASVAAGAVELISPLIDDLDSQVISTTAGIMTQTKYVKSPVAIDGLAEMNYTRLNGLADYTMDVNPMSKAQYASAYN